jgi:hypothetical protein
MINRNTIGWVMLPWLIACLLILALTGCDEPAIVVHRDVVVVGTRGTLLASARVGDYAVDFYDLPPFVHAWKCVLRLRGGE